jgi:hypothetical protein
VDDVTRGRLLGRENVTFNAAPPLLPLLLLSLDLPFFDETVVDEDVTATLAVVVEADGRLRLPAVLPLALPLVCVVVVDDNEVLV